MTLSVDDVERIVNDDVYDALQALDRYRTFLVAVRDHLDDIGALD